MRSRFARGWAHPGTILAGSVLLVLAALDSGAAPNSRGPVLLGGEAIVHRLAYVGADYSLAIRDGEIIDAFEYAEMVRFSVELEESYRRLAGSDGPLLSEFNRLLHGVAERASPAEIGSWVAALLPRTAAEFGVKLLPERVPDGRRGAALYASDCAPCHGEAGDGQGVVKPSEGPLPRSFIEKRGVPLSAHQVFGASLFGIEGTGMPAFEESHSRSDLWDIAFHILALRDAAIGDGSGGASPVSSNVAEVTTLESAFVRLAEETEEAVVGVLAHARGEADPGSDGWLVPPGEAPPPGYRRLASGSGFVVDADGWILTRRAAVVDPVTGADADLVMVEFSDHTYERARLVASEPTLDIAVLKVEVARSLAAIAPATGTPPRVGQWAAARGDPPGGTRFFAAGNVAATPDRGCYQADLAPALLQTSLQVPPEVTGGPLLDLEGRAIGLLVPPPLAPSTGTWVPAAAVPIELVMTVVEALRLREERRSPWLGFSVAALSPGDRRRLTTLPRAGVLIDNLHEAGPAARAGVRVDDVLTAIDGAPAVSVRAFQRALYRAGIGREIELEVARGNELLQFRVIVEDRPAEFPPRS